MPVFTSGRYPHLQVRTAHGTARFRNGRAEVTDEQAAVLRAMGAEYGLAEETPAGAEREAAPAGRSSRKRPSTKE